jgi:hypothetical protein
VAPFPQWGVFFTLLIRCSILSRNSAARVHASDLSGVIAGVEGVGVGAANDESSPKISYSHFLGRVCAEAVSIYSFLVGDTTSSSTRTVALSFFSSDV